MKFGSGTHVGNHVIEGEVFKGSRSQAVVVVDIIKLYLVQTGHFLATTGYVAPSPNHVQHNVHNHSVSQCVQSPWKKNSV